MPVSASVTQIAQVGVETTPGTPVPVTRRLPGYRIKMKPAGNFNSFRSSGSIFSENVFPGEELARGTHEGGINYTDMVYALASNVGFVPPTVLNGGADGYLWVHKPSPAGTDADTLKAFTMEVGDSRNAYKYVQTVWNGLGFKFTRNEASHSGELLARAMLIQALTGAIPPVAKQAVAPTRVDLFYANTMADLNTYTVSLGTPTAGNFTLTYAGQTTSNIAYNATASAVQSALLALSSISSGNATVTGSAGGPYTIVIKTPGTLAGSGTGLTGGTFSVAFSANKVSRLFQVEFKVANRWIPVFQMDSTDTSFVELVLGEPQVSLMIKVGALTGSGEFTNAGSGALTLARMRAGTPQFFRVMAKGPGIGVNSYHFIMDVCAAVSKPVDLDDDGGKQAAGWEFEVLNDPTPGVDYPYQFQLLNNVSAL